MNTKLALAAMVAGGSMLLMGSFAKATELFDPSLATCTGTNCSSVLVGGVVNAYLRTPKPWTAEIRATSGRCLRLDVTSQTDDLEIVAVAPNGAVYRNDDSNGLRPLVKINPTATGFYTVQIANWSGSVSESSFSLAFGVYNLNNPNCSASTQPEMMTAAAKKSRQ